MGYSANLVHTSPSKMNISRVWPAGSSPRTPPEMQRIAGVDAGRIVCVFLVVVLHSVWLQNPVAVLCRVAVPFFFVASGYFLRKPTQFFAGTILRPLYRLLPLYVLWTLIYYLFAYATGLVPVNLEIGQVLSGGPAFHLWFLPALGISLAFIPVASRLFGRQLTGFLCVVLAAVALVEGSYHDVLGLSGPARRGATLAAPLFVFIGTVLARQKNLPGLLPSAALTILGFVGLMAEEVWIGHWSHQFLSHDFSIFTYLYGTGAFLLALALPENRLVKTVGQFGPYALGIYLSHVLFLWTFGALLPVQFAWAHVLQIVASFSCALALTLLLSRLPFLRRLVT